MSDPSLIDWTLTWTKGHWVISAYTPSRKMTRLSAPPTQVLAMCRVHHVSFGPRRDLVSIQTVDLETHKRKTLWLRDDQCPFSDAHIQDTEISPLPIKPSERHMLPRSLSGRTLGCPRNGVTEA
jgi:hypothetical protein